MKEIRGMWFPDDDTHFQQHLEKEPLVGDRGTYQHKKLSAAVSFVPESSRGLAVDVGAHVGLWTRVLATMFEHTVAFEPHPTLFACWERNCLNIDNASGYNIALSHTNDEVSIGYVEGNSGNAHVIDRPAQGARFARTYALDNFPLGKKIDFLKIDVEGWELYVVLGASETIQRDKPVIILEQKPGNAERYNQTRLAALQHVIKLGYKLVWEKSGDYVAQPA